MSFVANRAVNLLSLHYAFQALAQGSGGVFLLVYLLQSGLTPAQTILALMATVVMRYLARPPRMPFNPPELAGEMHFMAAGCADGHTPVMNSGPSLVASLARRPVALHSDLLLHDMGALGDGIAQGAASPTQMHTTPLWGLRVSAPYLHDGRPNTIADAITAHAGQGAAARDRFHALTAAQRDELLAFLRAL